MDEAAEATQTPPIEKQPESRLIDPPKFDVPEPSTRKAVVTSVVLPIVVSEKKATAGDVEPITTPSILPAVSVSVLATSTSVIHPLQPPRPRTLPRSERLVIRIESLPETVMSVPPRISTSPV